MHWQQHLFFPTRVSLCESDDTAMHREILALMRSDPRFTKEGYAEIADVEGLGDLVTKHACMRKLKNFLLGGLKDWLTQEGLRGNYVVETQLFSNYSPAGEFVPAHNHIAQVSGVYYVDVPDFSGKPIVYQEGSPGYWRMDKGVLILHDPRFNASLTGLDERNYVKIFPRPNMAILFPSYLWHSVTPHTQAESRIAIAVNFFLAPAEEEEKAVKEFLTV